MEADVKELSLTTIKGGALVEKFDLALERVVSNLADVNTTTKPREIVLTVRLTPNVDRTFLEILGTVKTKLAGLESVQATADLKFDSNGRAHAWNRKNRQMEIPFTTVKKGGDND